MKHSKLKLIVILLFFISLTALQAQEATPAAGGNASGIGGTVSYTVGQAFYTTSAGSNGTVAQGVQQPFDITEVSGIEQGKGILLECEVYPNPVTDYLKLKVDAVALTNLGSLNYQLFNINGKLISSNEFSTLETQVKMQDLPQGTYLLNISNENLKLKTFKIIKN